MNKTNKVLKRIGAIGDIHAESIFLEKSLQFLIKCNLDQIVSVGDIVDGRGDVDQCCELLERHGVSTVRGNHDRWLLDGEMRELKKATQWADITTKSQNFLDSLPSTQHFTTVGGSLLLCHGIERHDMAKVTADDYGYAIESNFELQDLIQSKRFRFVINGHTHQRMVRIFGEVTIINAGTLKYDNDPCFVVVDFEKNVVEFYNFANESISICDKIQL